MMSLMQTIRNWPGRWRRSTGPTCLMFHRVCAAPAGSIGPDAELAISPERFESLVRQIAGQFEPMTIEQIVEAVSSGQTLPCDAIALTFDDGYADNFSTAWPILRRHGVPATVYVTTSFIDGPCEPYEFQLAQTIRSRTRLIWSLGGQQQQWNLRDAATRQACYQWITARLKRLSPAERNTCLEHLGIAAHAGKTTVAMMSWDQVREMAADPLVTIGAHTHGHVPLTAMPRAQVRRDLQWCRHRIEQEIKQPVHHFSYPYGSVNDTVESMVRTAGFRSAVTTGGGRIDGRRPNLLRLPRVDAVTTAQTTRALAA